MTTSSTLTAPPTPPVRPERKQSPGRVHGGPLDPRLLLQAVPDALRKLDPRPLWKNPGQVHRRGRGGVHDRAGDRVQHL